MSYAIKVVDEDDGSTVAQQTGLSAAELLSNDYVIQGKVSISGGN